MPRLFLKVGVASQVCVWRLVGWVVAAVASLVWLIFESYESEFGYVSTKVCFGDKS